MANLITLLRFPFLFIYILFLYFGNTSLKLWSVPFIIFIIFMDTLDGIIARARQETSLLGSVLDIATDRTLEMLLWVVFADLGLISILVPLIVITRGTTVDAVRAVGMRHGRSAFEQLRSPLSNFLVSSRMMRSTYGALKTISFSLLTLTLALESMQSAFTDQIHILAVTFTWISVAVCLLRGVPVLIEGYSIFKTTPE
ncbi:MAG: CDP-alcohol phosphatidyltransferase family protein [Anaerolineales bacterium]